MDIVQKTAVVDRLVCFAAMYLALAEGRSGVTFGFGKDHDGKQSIWGPEVTAWAVKLDDEEYKELLDIMNEGKEEVFVFEPISMGMMDFSLRIWAHLPEIAAKPVPLFVLGGESLPQSERKVMKKTGLRGCILDDAWNAYSPFSHTEENKRWLEKYKLQMAYDFDHYDY